MQHEDPSLIQHIYDLTAIYSNIILNDSFYTLALPVIANDAEQFRNQNPEYINDPFAEINNSLRTLKENSLWLDRYQNFIDNMVYGTTLPTYKECMTVIETISNNIFKQFNQENFELLMLAESRLNEKDQSIRINVEEL